MLIIGIDPGISGSICFFQDGKIIDVVEMPTMTEGKKNKKQVNGSQIFNEILFRIKKLDKKDVKGQWTQKVFQVDDSPRYEGSGYWVHLDQKSYWENTTSAPLPRREYTKRNDYNVTERGNRQEITSTGWVHDQNNKKIIRKKVIGSIEREFVAIVQPITGGKAPAAPPITMFCGVFLFNQIV